MKNNCLTFRGGRILKEKGSDSAYLVESVHHGKASYSLHSTFDDALAAACCHLAAWLFANLVGDCPPALEDNIKTLLLEQKRDLEAIRLWNEHFADPVVGVHQVEIVKKGCHHDDLADPDDENYFLVQLDYEDQSVDWNLLACLEDALAFSTSYMVPVLPGGRSDRVTRQEAWRLVIEDRRAEAIDVWNSGQHPILYSPFIKYESSKQIVMRALAAIRFRAKIERKNRDHGQQRKPNRPSRRSADELAACRGTVPCSEGFGNCLRCQFPRGQAIG